MRKKILAASSGVLAMMAALYPAHAGKLDEWKKYRDDVALAMACEKGFIDSEINQINTDKNLQHDMNTQNHVLPNLQERQKNYEPITIKPITSDQECNDKLYAALGRYLSSNPHATVEEVETSFKSAIGNYLFGRWGVHQARLGHGDRLLTASAFQIKDRLFTIRDQLRRPAKEFGRDAAIKEEAAKDPLLQLFISWDSDAKSGGDNIGNSINDIENNMTVNGVFTYDETTYTMIKKATQGNEHQKAIVSAIVPSSVNAAEEFVMKDGEKEPKVKAATYSIVFFRPIEFTAAECASYVKTGTWSFTSSGLTPQKACTQLAAKAAKIIPYPVAINPALEKLLKPNVSNMNCLLNSKFIRLNGVKSKQVLASSSGKKKGDAPQHIFASESDADNQNADGSRKKYTAMSHTSAQYDIPSESPLDTCVPITIYEGWNAKKKLKVYLGIALAD